VRGETIAPRSMIRWHRQSATWQLRDVIFACLVCAPVEREYRIMVYNAASPRTPLVTGRMQ
jgi:hypothetical protein